MLSYSPSLSLKLVCGRLEICNIVPGDCAVCSRSASLHPATELLSARGRASVCSGLCCESSSGSSVLISALVGSLQFSAQPWSLPETLRHNTDKKYPGCPHFIWDISLVELEMQISASICTGVASVSGSKGSNSILLVTRLIHIRSFTSWLFAFALTVLLRDCSS